METEALSDVAVGKSGRVEFRCFPRLAMIEPQTGDDFSAHRNSLTILDDIPRLLTPDALFIDLGLDEPCQVSQRLLPTEITGLGWNDVRQA